VSGLGSRNASGELELQHPESFFPSFGAYEDLNPAVQEEKLNFDRQKLKNVPFTKSIGVDNGKFT
jgi:hypothetical protein